MLSSVIFKNDLNFFLNFLSASSNDSYIMYGLDLYVRQGPEQSFVGGQNSHSRKTYALHYSLKCCTIVVLVLRAVSEFLYNVLVLVLVFVLLHSSHFKIRVRNTV